LIEWLGRPVPIEVDHVNGKNTDHRLENLRLLCPNCHALTPTWRGRKRRRTNLAA
jgi:5-methylcytosine-specific restriction endonuclease McrA